MNRGRRAAPAERPGPRLMKQLLESCNLGGNIHDAVAAINKDADTWRERRIVAMQFMGTATVVVYQEAKPRSPERPERQTLVGSLATYLGRDDKEYDEDGPTTQISATLEGDAGLRVLMGSGENAPDIHFERQTGCWSMNITPFGGGDPQIQVRIADDGAMRVERATAIGRDHLIAEWDENGREK